MRHELSQSVVEWGHQAAPGIRGRCLFCRRAGRGSRLEVDFGRLPQMLGMALGMANVNGILGAALLNDFRLHFAASLREIRMDRLCDTICR